MRLKTKARQAGERDADHGHADCQQDAVLEGVPEVRVAQNAHEVSAIECLAWAGRRALPRTRLWCGCRPKQQLGSAQG